jgi:hypothetical protein
MQDLARALEVDYVIISEVFFGLEGEEIIKSSIYPEVIMFSARDKEPKIAWQAITKWFVTAPEEGYATKESGFFEEILFSRKRYSTDVMKFAPGLILTYDRIAELFALKLKHDRGGTR